MQDGEYEDYDNGLPYRRGDEQKQSYLQVRQLALNITEGQVSERPIRLFDTPAV